MIRRESIVTALIGAALGLPLGVVLAALTTRALGSLGIGFHLPGQQLAYFVLLAVAAGIGAAVLPARRAARLQRAARTPVLVNTPLEGSRSAPHARPGTVDPNPIALST